MDCSQLGWDRGKKPGWPNLHSGTAVMPAPGEGPPYFGFEAALDLEIGPPFGGELLPPISTLTPTFTLTPSPTWTPTLTNTPTPTPTVRGDLYPDGMLSGFDLLAFLQDWYRNETEFSLASDLIDDGTVDSKDLLELIKLFRK
jgi:hypothetical protein